SGSPTDVRAQLGPLQMMAEEMDVAFSIVTHPSKGGNNAAIDQYIGSQSFIAAVRIGLLCVKEMGVDMDGKMTPTGRFLYANPKNNLAATAATLAYKIENAIIGEKPKRLETVRIKWEEQVAISADDALAAARGSTRTTPVDEFIREQLI